jgi:hypothetical protein
MNDPLSRPEWVIFNTLSLYLELSIVLTVIAMRNFQVLVISIMLLSNSDPSSSEFKSLL